MANLDRPFDANRASEGRFAWPSFGAAAQLPAAMRRPGAARAAQEEFEAGYDAGHQAGLAAAADEVRALKERLASSIRSLEQTRVRIDAEQRERLIEVAHAVCRKVLDVELATDRRVLETFVGAAIEHLEASAADVRVHVNPADIIASRESLAGVVVEADPGVPEGGCSVRTESRSVDFDPYGVLEQIFAESSRA